MTARTTDAVLAELRRAAPGARGWKTKSELARALRLEPREVDRCLRTLAARGLVERAILDGEHRVAESWRAAPIARFHSLARAGVAGVAEVEAAE
jgi:DNA-binding IclR family transcriptional regulator